MFLQPRLGDISLYWQSISNQTQPTSASQLLRPELANKTSEHDEAETLHRSQKDDPTHLLKQIELHVARVRSQDKTHCQQIDTTYAQTRAQQQTCDSKFTQVRKP